MPDFWQPFYFQTKRRGGQVPPRDVEAIKEEDDDDALPGCCRFCVKR